ncbi:MAG TPA: HAD family acid phosphatase [Gaiella sp.]|jgi:predicted secreted acid phosphatase
MRRVSRLALATAVVAVAGVVVAVALAAEPAIKTTTPKTEDQITNIDVLRQQIRNYYGDPLGSGVFADDSNYAREAGGVAEDGGRYLADRARGHDHSKGDDRDDRDDKSGDRKGEDDKRKDHGEKKLAIVLDVDDTTLATWNYEIFSNWAFNPTTNGQFVTEQRFPAVPGMVDMVTKAADEGYKIFFLTGRPQAQEAATLGNLTRDGVGVDAGYPAPSPLTNSEDGLFTKPAIGSYPDYLDKPQFCGPSIAAGVSCPTIQYKSGVRAHIEDLGYEIVGNFGDQFSDLEGGFADKTFKLPNPNYFLP